MKAGRSGRRLRTAYALFYIGVLYLPVLFLPLFSFNDSLYLAFPLKGFTLRWYRALLDNDALQSALVTSLIVATMASLTATLLGTLAAKPMIRPLAGAGMLTAVLMAPLVVPGMILAVALLMLFSYLEIPLTILTIAVGHIVICVPFAVGVMRSRFDGFNVDLEHASADLGENAWFTFWRVTFPLVLPGIVASVLLCFTISFDEFIVAFFLSSNRPTLPIFIWSQMRFPDRLPLVMALGSALLAGSVSVILLAETMRRRGMPGKSA